MADVEALKRRIRAHPAFGGGPADEGYWLDFLECTLAKFGSYEFMVDCLADSCERQPETLAAYIVVSEHDRLTWDALHALVPRLRADGKDVPPALRDWCMDVATGVSKRPKQGGKVKWRNRARDISIVAAVNGIRDVTDLPFEFDEPKSREPRSACHVVAERLDMKYPTVRTIWRKNRSIVDRAREHGLVPPGRGRTRRPS